MGFLAQRPQEDNILLTSLEVWGRGHEASVYYRLLMDKIDQNFHSALRRIWSNDLNLSLSDEDWSRICRNCKTVSRNLGVRLIQFKILNRFYWTPSRLFRLGLKDSAKCWKCEREDGDLMHALWSCSEIQTFWLMVHNYI